MSISDTDTSEIKDLLLWFISEQREVNTEFRGLFAEQKEVNAEFRGLFAEQKEVNTEFRGSFAEQKTFNERIEKKIDAVQYFLEETIAEDTRMLLEEHIELKGGVKEIEDEVAVLRDNVILLTSDQRKMKLQLS